MPVYSFDCTNCKTSYKDLCKAEELAKCPSCGQLNSSALPSNVMTTVMETRDPNTGKQVRKDQEKLLKDRMTKHHDKYELTEKIDKFGMNDAIKHGWDKKVKKV